MMEGATYVLSGASGLVGTALAELLEASNNRVIKLVRRAPKNDREVRWDPEKGELDAASVAGANAFIHLSGENVGEGRWTDERKKSLLESRTHSTALIAKTILAMDPK